MKDLREWMQVIRDMGELIEVHTEVDPHLEITEIADRVMKAGGPAILFTNVTGSKMPVLINQFSSERRMAAGLGGTRADRVEPVDAGGVRRSRRRQPPGLGLKRYDGGLDRLSIERHNALDILHRRAALAAPNGCQAETEQHDNGLQIGRHAG